MKNSSLFLSSCCLLGAFTIAVHTQTGGSFDLRHNVVAGGGGSSSAGTMSVSGTVGQAVAGTTSLGAPYSLHGGFWSENLQPSATAASISGRVTTADGQGIRNVRLTLSAPDGTTRTTISSSFGYYSIDGVEVGHTYVLMIAAKRYTFANPTRIFSMQEGITGMDWIAMP